MRKPRPPGSADIYHFAAYKPYLHALVGPKNKRSGLRGQIAKTLKIQATYVSQVLYGNADFSLEQAESLSDFLNHTSEEKLYFLLLIQKDRAGTQRLEKHFYDQIQSIRDKRLVLTERLGASHTLSSENQAAYYSSWHFSAIHMALTIEGMTTASHISAYLGIPPVRVNEVLEFLCKAGLAEKNHSRYSPSVEHVRLGKASYNILKHHSNWRNKAIESLEYETLSDLHYSAVVTLSKIDALALKESILDFIKESLKTIRASEGQEICALNLDFFSLKRG
ncbi:MAG: TIGR02147 family protein [Bdellovibrionota bacterium]